jgi:hypothetical protein
MWLGMAMMVGAGRSCDLKTPVMMRGPKRTVVVLTDMEEEG